MSEIITVGPAITQTDILHVSAPRSEAPGFPITCAIAGTTVPRVR